MAEVLLEKNKGSTFLKKKYPIKGKLSMKRNPSFSLSAFLWINFTAAVILILLCHSSQVADARVLARRTGNEVGKEKAPMEKPMGLNDSPGNLEDDLDEEAHIASLKDVEMSNALGTGPSAYVRDTRAVANRRKNDFKVVEEGVKHVQRIPTSTGQSKDHAKHGTPPPPDVSSDEDPFESLEANREAFLEVLNENAKHPHRRRSYKRHSSKMNLKFDDKTQRWTLTEQQSDEWF